MSDSNKVDVPTEDPRADSMKRAPSLVVINTGPGKGKTTAAIGIIIRSVGREWPVAVVQYVKSGKWQTGEEKVCRQLGVDWWAMGDGFSWDSKDLEHDKALAADAWAHTRSLIESDKYRLVVMDEITYPINWGWIDLDDVINTVKTRPSKVNLVFTGRDAPQALIDVADTVSQVEVVKHAYESGIAAKKGIDM